MKSANTIPFAKPPQSYWMVSTEAAPYPVLQEDLQVDVAIIGGGMSGITCGYLLAKEGIKTVILEADRILQGTTGHTTAKITSQHGLIYHKLKSSMSLELAQQYASSNEAAIRLIEGLQKELNIDCDFIHQPAYIFTEQEQYIKQIQDETETALQLGIQASYLEKIPFDMPVRAAVRFENQAQFHPRKYLIPLAAEYVKLGGSIYEQTRAIALDTAASYIISTAQGKKVTTKKVIIASHYPFYNKHGLYFARIYPEKSYAIAIAAKEKYPGGMYITAEDPGRSLRSVTCGEKELIIVGGEHHKTGQGVDTRIHYDALVHYAKEHFTVEDIPYRWSTQDCMTVDNVPYIGQFASDTPNLYVATGYAKWGMTGSTAAAVILKDLIVSGSSPYQAVYNPSRKTIMASAKEFIKETANVAKELIKGKLSALPHDFSIEAGEAKVIDGNGQRIGAYREDSGVLHLVNTTCTHMGCELQWNAAERSWDCPCHGSRFSYDGEIIEGPAVTPLEYNRDVNTFERVLKEKY